MRYFVQCVFLCMCVYVSVNLDRVYVYVLFCSFVHVIFFVCFCVCLWSSFFGSPMGGWWLLRGRLGCVRVDDPALLLRTGTMLVCDRIAFTFKELLQNLMCTPLQKVNVSIVVLCVLKVMKQLAEAARAGIMPRDWHIGNIAFHDTKDASPMWLVDFERNDPAAANVSYKQRMAATMKAFLTHLPLAHRWGDMNVKSASRAWIATMDAIAKSLREWWDQWCQNHCRDDELPDSKDWEELNTLLMSCATEDSANQDVQEFPTSVQMPIPYIPAASASYATVTPTSVPTDPDAAASHVSVATRAPAHEVPSETCDVCTASDSEDVEIVINDLVGPAISLPNNPMRCNVGLAAARALVFDAITKHRQHSHEVYKNGLKRTQNSMPLAERKKKRHFTQHVPSRETSEGDDLGLLFRLLIVALKEKRPELNNKCYLDRMGDEEKWPQVVLDPVKFHSEYWVKFAKFCEGKWDTMTSIDKLEYFRSWLFKKFTLDPKARTMYPRRGYPKPRNEISWDGFWLTDYELYDLASDVFIEYSRHRTLLSR